MFKNVFPSPYRYALVGLMLVNLILVELNIGIWIKSAIERLFIASDFTVYYTAFTMVREGEVNSLYDQGIESEYQKRVMENITFKDGWLPFPIPPHFALLFSFLSYIPFELAYFLWSILELGLLYWLICLLNDIFNHWDKHLKLIALTILLAFWPLAHTVLLGQLSIFLLICLVKMYIFIKRSRYSSAGVWLALTILKPQTLLVPSMMTLNKRFWRIATGALVCVIIIIASTSVVIGIKPWIHYLQLLQKMSSAFSQAGVFPEREFTLRGTLFNILGYSKGNLINIISISTLLLGMLLIFLIWRKVASYGRVNIELQFAFMLTISIVISLHLFDHDSLVLVFPIALLYDYLQQNKLPWKGYSIFVMSMPTVFFISAFSKFNLFGIIRPPVVMELVLLGWIIYYLVHEQRHPEINLDELNVSRS